MSDYWESDYKGRHIAAFRNASGRWKIFLDRTLYDAGATDFAELTDAQQWLERYIDDESAGITKRGFDAVPIRDDAKETEVSHVGDSRGNAVEETGESASGVSD